MSNSDVEIQIDEGEQLIDKIDSYAKGVITFTRSWKLLGKIAKWAFYSGSQLTLLGENRSRIRNLLSKNPAELNAIDFSMKMAGSQKTKMVALSKLKDFVLTMNDELIKKIDDFPRNHVYIDNEVITSSDSKKRLKFDVGTKRRIIFNLLLESQKPIKGIKLLEKCGYKNYSILNKEINGINQNFIKQLDLTKNIILHAEEGGYQLNREIYNFSVS